MASADGKYMQFWARLGTRARIGFVVGVVAIVVAAVGLAVWTTDRDYQVLFSQLAEADAANVVEQLKRQKIPYRLTDGGTTVKVPAEQVYETRLALLSSGMPLSGGVGFEIFDHQGMGTTEQSQRVTYQRALQGELARTIGALNDIKYARVHLVLPESTVFKRDREEPRASVTLVVKSAAAPSREEVTGIQRLVAAAVAGLDPAKVVITDQRGITLSGADALGTGAAASEARLSIKRDIEEYVARKIVALLDRAYGAGQALVSVDVALNFDEIKSTVQDIVPLRGGASATEGAVLRKRQVEAQVNTSEVLSSESAAAPPHSRPTTGTTEVEYEFGRRIEQVIGAPGGITRMSVGVVVPGALDDAKRARIADLVRVAAGINEARGDAVVVEPLDQLTTPGTSTTASPALAESNAGGPAEHPEAAAGGVWLQSSQTLRVGAVVVILIGLALVVGLFVGRRAAVSRKLLTHTERQQLLLELEHALGTVPGGGA